MEDETIHVKATTIDPEGEAEKQHAKGVKQMAVGGALAAAGVAMMILPGPGALALAGGAVLFGKGYKNVTGKDVISKETKADPDFQQGQAAGEEWAQRVREFATNEAAPAGKKIAEGAKEGASTIFKGVKDAAETGADLAGKGFRAVAGNKVADTVGGVVSPIAEAAGNVAGKAAEVAKPVVTSAAEKGKEAASSAARKVSEKAKDLMED